MQTETKLQPTDLDLLSSQKQVLRHWDSPQRIIFVGGEEIHLRPAIVTALALMLSADQTTRIGIYAHKKTTANSLRNELLAVIPADVAATFSNRGDGSVVADSIARQGSRGYCPNVVYIHRPEDCPHLESWLSSMKGSLPIKWKFRSWSASFGNHLQPLCGMSTLVQSLG